MNSGLNGKVILITGASSGIGKAIAKRLAKENAVIVLFGGRNTEKLYSVQAEINSLGAECFAISGDITDGYTVNAGLNGVFSKYGKIDVLINNAGMASRNAFSEVTEKEFDDIVALDVKAPFFLTQKTLPFLKKSDYATVVNIASVVGHVGYPMQSAYSMAKHALIGFTQSLAKEVYKDKIRVHLISPGGVYTDMIKLTRPDLSGDDMILPEDVAESVAFLLLNRGNAVIDEICMHRTGKEPF